MDEPRAVARAIFRPFSGGYQPQRWIPRIRTRSPVRDGTTDWIEWRGKRALDIVGALVLGIVFLPLIVTVSVLLWAEGGPVIYRHTRIGRGGRRFQCCKFATMVKDADKILEELLKQRPELQEEWNRDHKLRNDPRVTRIGRFLRKTSLDELPQLWNVLKGEMSLVGPRPVVREEITRYRTGARHYLAMRPGITGLWQVSWRNDTLYRRRVALDRAYAMRASLWLDAWILLRTVSVVLGRRGAY